MEDTRLVVLILGAGANTGDAVATKFEAEGYSVAIASRSIVEGKISAKRWSYRLDLHDLSAVSELFQKVHKETGIPSVVIHTGESYGVL